MGFDGFFFGRIDYDDKKKRLANQTMEMVWQGSQNLGPSQSIFASVNYNLYQPPPGLCFDVHCLNDPIQDDPNLFDNNVKEKVDLFVKAAKDQAKHYKTNNIMFTMGSDFHYESAVEWFKNLDKLIHYVNLNGSVNAMYSTPSIYLDYKQKAGENWTVKYDDFFPYADNPYAYWTGYYTSRPALKGYSQKLNNFLQACKQLEALHDGFPENGPSSISLQHALGVSQHHDAITGTEQQHVADDYAKRLHIGQVECAKLMAQALNNLGAKSERDEMELEYCEYLNISVCPASESRSFNVLAYNPLARNWTGVLRMPVSSPRLTVMGPSGEAIPTQIIPVSAATKAVRQKKGNAAYELVFGVDESNAIPPLGHGMFTVRPSTDQHNMFTQQPKPHPHVVLRQNAPVSIGNEFVTVEFNSQNGHISTLTNLASDMTIKLDQEFRWHNASNGRNANKTQASGAYIFRPNNTNTSTDAYPIHPSSNIATLSTPVKGQWVQEVQQTYADWLTQVVRVYKGIPGVELEYTVGPIPFKDGLGKEVISRFTTDLMTNGIWYTDANGREMQMRKRNYRPTWKWNNTAPISGNYYPVNSRIYIRDTAKNIQFTVLNDRSQGGSSLLDGQIELMVHRRCLFDDGRGVAEALNETGQYGEGLIVRGKHFLLLDSVENSTYWHRVIGERMMMEPVLFFAPSSSSYGSLNENFKLTASGLMNPLPINVHLLTLEYQEEGKMLLRLENQFEKVEPVAGNLNTAVTVNLSTLFSRGIRVVNYTELLLGGNAPLSSVKRLSWKTIEGFIAAGSSQPPSHSRGSSYSSAITLSPMDIRTFNLTVSRG